MMIPFAAVLLSAALTSAEQEETHEQTVVVAFVGLRDRLKIGDTIFVTETSGRVIKGKIRDFSWETPALTLEKPEQVFENSRGESDKKKLEGPFTVMEADPRQIDLEFADSLASGALIGLAVGATPGLLALAFGESEASAYGGYHAAFWGGIGAAIGALADHGTKSRRPIYSAPGQPSVQLRWAPILSRGCKGVSFTVEF